MFLFLLMIMEFYTFLLTWKMEYEHVESVLLSRYKSKVLHVAYDEGTAVIKTHAKETASHMLWNTYSTPMFCVLKGLFFLINSKCCLHKKYNPCSEYVLNC